MPGWAQDSDPGGNKVEESDTIQGVVLNSVTHEPIERALVSSPDSRFATMTDGQGHFEFKLPKAGISGDGSNRPTALLPRKPGYLTEPVEMELKPSSKEVVSTLTPEALIVGHVSLPSDESADQIPVELYVRHVEEGRGHWVPGAQTTTRSNGEFRFADLAAGTYKLMTREQLDRDQMPTAPGVGQLYGYAPVYFPSATSLSAAETITVSAGQTLQADMTLTRQPYFQVKVSVGSAAPLTGLGVTASSAGGHGPGYSLGYNSQTQSIEGLLPQGLYSLEGVAFAQPPTVGEATLTVRNAPVSVSRMTMMPAQSISINVKEEFTSERKWIPVEMFGLGGPVRGPRSYLNVRLEPAEDFTQRGGASLRPPTGPKDETLVLDGVVPGRYWVQIDSSRGYASSVTAGDVDLLADPLVVSGGASGPIEITMRDDTAQLEGTVEGADSSMTTGTNRPFAHVYCVPLPDSHGRYAEAASAADGTFLFPLEIPPGAYRVMAFRNAQKSIEYRNPEVMRDFDGVGTVIHLTGGQKEHVTLPLAAKGEQ